MKSFITDTLDVLLDERTSDADAFTILLTLSERENNAADIVAAVRYLRARALPIAAPFGAVDCCGTGGDGLHTLNISTAVALVAAACGVPVAKHGNRAASSASGAADVLEAAGVNLTLPRAALEQALRDFNFAFLMAADHYPFLARLRGLRKRIGRRTMFNLIGPLLNPAHVKIQLLGVYDRTLCPVMAEALQALGSEKAWIVHGADGMDEISLGGPTYTQDLNGGTRVLNPEDFGLRPIAPQSLRGGDALENAKALHGLLEGAQGPYRDTVLANTAALLHVHGAAPDLKTGLRMAAEALDSHTALKNFEAYKEFSKGFKS